jgi:hypothetical protein
VPDDALHIEIEHETGLRARFPAHLIGWGAAIKWGVTVQGSDDPWDGLGAYWTFYALLGRKDVLADTHVWEPEVTAC